MREKKTNQRASPKNSFKQTWCSFDRCIGKFENAQGINNKDGRMIWKDNINRA
jgi:hypothetical protein